MAAILALVLFAQTTTCSPSLAEPQLRRDLAQSKVDSTFWRQTASEQFDAAQEWERRARAGVAREKALRVQLIIATSTPAETPPAQPLPKPGEGLPIWVMLISLLAVGVGGAALGAFVKH